MKKRIAKVITVSTALIVVGCAYAVFFRITEIGIRCPINLITGLQCPGCGTTRMAVSLLRGDLSSAWSYNPVVLCMLPAGAVFAVCGIKRYIQTGRNDQPKWEKAAMIVMICVLLVYGVLRNFI